MADLEFLRNYPTTILESAVALFGVRPRDTGVLRPALSMYAPSPVRIAGYAATALVSADAAERHGRSENLDFWDYVHRMPGPKIAVLSDASPVPGVTGAACGRLTATVLRACGCQGLITNGGVRDIDEMEAMNFPVFAAHLTVAHGNPHVAHFGKPVQVQGVTIASGDIVCADRHGAILIPAQTLPHLPEAIAEVERRVDPVLEYCKSAEFSPRGVAAKIDQHMRKVPRWKPSA